MWLPSLTQRCSVSSMDIIYRNGCLETKPVASDPGTFGKFAGRRDRRTISGTIPESRDGWQVWTRIPGSALKTTLEISAVEKASSRTLHPGQGLLHSCQLSRNGRDSPGILGLVPVVSRLSRNLRAPCALAFTRLHGRRSLNRV